VVSSTNKTDPHDIAEILLKVVIKPSNKQTKQNIQLEHKDVNSKSKQSTRNIKKPTPKQNNQPGT
jgi:hypothetical protein